MLIPQSKDMLHSLRKVCRMCFQLLEAQLSTTLLSNIGIWTPKAFSPHRLVPRHPVGHLSSPINPKWLSPSRWFQTSIRKSLKLILILQKSILQYPTWKMTLAISERLCNKIQCMRLRLFMTRRLSHERIVSKATHSQFRLIYPH